MLKYPPLYRSMLAARFFNFFFFRLNSTANKKKKYLIKYRESKVLRTQFLQYFFPPSNSRLPSRSQFSGATRIFSMGLSATSYIRSAVCSGFHMGVFFKVSDYRVLNV